MAKVGFKLGKQSKGDRFRPWYKRFCRKTLRREGKKIEDAEVMVHPRPSYLGWD